MNLKDDKQRNIQMQLDFSSALTGEAREAGREETESSGAMNETKSPASTNRLMEEVCERENLKAALQRVKANKGSPGVDGMTVFGITDYLKQHWPAIREQLLNGTYVPKPVRRVEIPKPDGGVRKLGIPTVLDRFIQQAVMQVLQRRWNPTFSDHSYGFRPGRSAQQAVAQAQQYIVTDRDISPLGSHIGPRRRPATAESILSALRAVFRLECPRPPLQGFTKENRRRNRDLDRRAQRPAAEILTLQPREIIVTNSAFDGGE